MLTHEEIANKIVNVLKGNDTLYTDGNILSTDKNDFPAQYYTQAEARDIILLSNQIDTYKNDDGEVIDIELFVEINNEEVYIDLLNNKVTVGFYNSVEIPYRPQDDIIGLYDEITSGDYI